jgi:hypothetical protein
MEVEAKPFFSSPVFLGGLGISAVNYLLPTFSGRWNISTAVDSFSARRFWPYS